MNGLRNMKRNKATEFGVYPTKNLTATTNAVGDSMTVDWVTAGAVTPIKDQGQCGSCWSFSATGGLEGAYQIAGNALTSFSEEQLVECAGL